MSEKEYIVTLNKGVDYDAFNAEMIASTGAGDIPNRTVDVADARPGSLRNTHYALTDAEAAALRNDSRVVDVQIPPQDRDDIEIGFSAYQSGVWTRDTVTQQSNLNWGNLRCTRIEDPWNGNTLTDISEDYKYTLTGRGVDVVIQDSGIQPTHYQFTNDLGLSRVKQIDWYAASGVSGTQSANHYRDYNGHGSHCAGTVAGRTLGWAREADIYAVKVSGLEGSGDAGTGISVSNCFDVITGWHNNKPIDPKTGFKRPTVVNASWGYSGTRTGTLTGGVYAGQSWSTGTGQPWPDTEASHLEYAGIHGKYYSLGTARRINVRVASVDADLQDAIDAGIIFCIAAGNSYYYIDSATGPNWNDTADFGAGQENIFRGSSPYDTEAFMVGNIDNTYYNSKEQKAESSCFGPGVDINAPGTYIMSCASSDKGGACDLTDGTDASVATVNDPGTNSNLDPLMKISGTSMASPQVAGMVACILQANPGMTPAQMKTYIHNNSLQDLLWEDTQHTLVADTFTASTTVANGTTDYTFTAGSDRNGAISGNDPNITIYQGDTIEITNSIGAHPLYIKTVSGVADTNNQVTTPAATGQGATNGTVSWTPALPGRFYYQCSSHANMWGQIEVLPRVDWNNLDNIGDGPNRYLYSGLFATGDNLRVKGPVRWGQEKIVAPPESGGGGGSGIAWGGDRGLFGGGSNGSTNVNTIDYVDITTPGNATDFGDLTAERQIPAACSSSTRGVWGGGELNGFGATNTLDYVTIATTGNAIDFGDLTVSEKDHPVASSNGTIGLFGAGNYVNNRIDSITIATTGNATDFGDLSVARDETNGAAGDATRALWFGGYNGSNVEINTIDYNTYASAGNAIDFGDLTVAGRRGGAASDETRAVVFGGISRDTTIDYVTIQTTGNATDFGDCSSVGGNNGASSGTYGIFSGNLDIQRLTIQTLGNATDFGDLSVNRILSAACAGSPSGSGGGGDPGGSIDWSGDRGIAATGGGTYSGATNHTNDIEYYDITTTGNAAVFGNLTIKRGQGLGAAGSSTTGLFFGGRNGDNPGGRVNTIDYITISTIGNATDFGDLTVARSANTAAANGTRAICAAGWTGSSSVNTIDYVTIATTGNALDFGDLSGTGSIVPAGTQDDTRAIFAGSIAAQTSDVIEYVTIATTGNSTDFGNLTEARDRLTGVSNNSRALIASDNSTNNIEYVTIQTTGNATGFGNLTVARQDLAGAENATRACFAGGSAETNVIDYVTMATPGNAVDFGDLVEARKYVSGNSGSPS